MYEAGQKNPGGMLAIIGLRSEATEAICLRTGTEISNINCPGQIVISGSISAISEASELARNEGARFIPLKVSGAFHSALMEPAMTEFSKIVPSFTFRSPTIPIIANVTAQPLADSESIKEELLKQLRSCVQWQASVEYMINNSVSAFYEIGPGRVLSGLIKRINPEVPTFNISGIENIAQLGNLV